MGKKRVKPGTKTPGGRLRLAREKKPKRISKAEIARGKFRSLLNPFKRRILLEAIASGNWQHVACAAAGIREDQLREWRELGVAGDPVFAEFVMDLDRAEASAEALAVSIIREAATGLEEVRTTVMPDKDGKERKVVETTKRKDWRAAAWFLEHRHAQRWAAMRRMQHTGVLSMRQQVIVHDPEDAELHEFALKEAQDDVERRLPAHEEDQPE